MSRVLKQSEERQETRSRKKDGVPQRKDGVPQT